MKKMNQNKNLSFYDYSKIYFLMKNVDNKREEDFENLDNKRKKYAINIGNKINNNISLEQLKKINNNFNNLNNFNENNNFININLENLTFKELNDLNNIVNNFIKQNKLNPNFKNWKKEIKEKKENEKKIYEQKIEENKIKKLNKVFISFENYNENKNNNNNNNLIYTSINLHNPKHMINNNINYNNKYNFDCIFSHFCNQKLIYNYVGKEIVNDVLRGYNGTIFAYGQSGSGKTYTMYGKEDNEYMGLIPRIIYEIFEYVENSDDNIIFEFKMSVLLFIYI